MNRDDFYLIMSKYGKHSSWAIWADEGPKPKDNVGDISIFSNITEENINLLNVKYIILALNVSFDLAEAELFANFHSNSPVAQDYKLRYALRDTPLWGAYITDVIKDHPDVSSGSVKSFLNQNPSVLMDNIKSLEAEMQFIGGSNAILFALGDAAYNILKKSSIKNRIIKIPHYAKYTSRDAYREEIKLILDNEHINT